MNNKGIMGNKAHYIKEKRKMRLRIRIKRWIVKRFFQPTQIALYIIVIILTMSFYIWNQGQGMSLKTAEASEITVPKPDSLKTTEEIVREVARDRGFKDVENLLNVLRAESGLREDAVGSNYHPNGLCGTNRATSVDRGVAQFNDICRYDVSDECAMDTACAVNEMISTVNKRGSYDRWHASKKLRLK